MKQIYLASSSPRRKELLTQLIGNNFEIIKSEYEENNTLDMPPEKLVLHHAINKGRDVAKNLKKGIVISADTLVAYDKKVLGKPITAEKAKEMLKKISGKVVEVITGYSVTDTETNQEISGYEITKVQIRELTETIINAYIASGEPLDKAGAFGIQEKGVVIAGNINGSYPNVVGLPLYQLSKAFEKLGFSIFDFK